MKPFKELTAILLCVFMLAGLTGGAEAAQVVLNGTDDELLSCAKLVLRCLKDRDFVQLASFVHEDKGVVFSPYAYVDTDAFRLTAAQVKELKLADEFTWGVYDGSGDPMVLSVEDYFDRFAYRCEFAEAPQTAVDKLIKTGNTYSNLEKAFPDAHFVEYHFPGFEPEYEGIDWASLRLVFEKVGEVWMLVGVVNDCWTI